MFLFPTKLFSAGLDPRPAWRRFIAKPSHRASLRLHEIRPSFDSKHRVLSISERFENHFYSEILEGDCRKNGKKKLSRKNCA